MAAAAAVSAATITEVLLLVSSADNLATVLLRYDESNLPLVLVCRQVAASIRMEPAQRFMGPLLVDCVKSPRLLVNDVR